MDFHRSLRLFALAFDGGSPTSIFRPAATPAHSIFGLSMFVLAITGAIFVIVTSLLAYAVIRFRERPSDTSGDPAQVFGSTQIETSWTVIPLLIVVVLFLTAARVILATEAIPKPKSAMDVQVVGHQFFFEFRYPGFKESLVSPKDEMVLPVGRPVRILLSSSDVLHQFWVPDFRLKLATVPGLVQDMNFTPLRTGTYDIVCSEYCGLLHSHMQAKVVVEAQDVFDKWYSTHKSESAAATNSSIPLASGTAPAGQTLFNQKCTACHAIAPFDHKVVGPGLDKITNDPAHPNLVDGKPPTPANIANIIENGYTGSIGTMPNSQANGLAPKDVADLTAYLVSLK